jgi:hypothetical protein
LGWSEDKYRKDKVARGGYNWRKEFRKRIEEAEWTPHGYKHKKAKTVEEAKEKSMKGKRPPAQYLPGIDNEKLEREALRKAEYIYVDKDKNVVYFFYDTRRPVGYDGGDETTWIRAELRKDENTPVLHGHPISVKRLENEYLKDKNKKSWFLRRRMGE